MAREGSSPAARATPSAAGPPVDPGWHTSLDDPHAILSMLGSTPDAVFAKDREGRYVLLNHVVAEIFGRPAAAILGRRDDELLPAPLTAALRGRDDEVLATGRPAQHEDTLFHAGLGELRVFLCTRSVWRVPATGDIGGLVAHAADITERSVSATRHDVAERRRLDEEMERRRAELARSNAELEQFAYVASHDLQEPLRAVASHTQLLEERYADRLDDRARRHIRHAVDGAHRMQALIDDLLMLSRVGTHARALTPVDLDRVLAEVLRALDVSAEESGAVIRSAPMPTVVGDAAQLGQVFQNLIGNALKFHRPGVPPVVDVSAKETEGEWTISVRDNGIGIDPAFADRVFEVFRRLHSREEYPGTGIGLSICRKVVERHGGRIWVEPAPDGGSVFRFTLPRVGPAAHSGMERDP